MMTEPDWDFLLDTARLHHEFWSGRLELGPEIRLRLQKFGVTPEDRARIRIEVGTANELTPACDQTNSRATTAEVASLDDRRNRLAGGADAEKGS
ncbi:hypothetical protein ACRAWB_18275 [Leifsonia poae]|uniref:phage terminase small subunit n=1 Tax=Leifsonia poae TaxID=110933 RepID=UPI003D682920